MKRLGLVVAPIFFAVRRVRARPLSFATLVLAFAGAGALIGWSSLTAALAQEKAVRIRLETLPPGARSFRVVYFMLPQEADYRAGTVAEALAGLAGVTERTRRIRIWHSIEPGRSLGTRLVVAREAAADVAVRAGRLPAGCRGRVCEALALGGGAPLGRRVALGKGVSALIVGDGALRPELVPDTSELGQRPLLVASVAGPLGALVANHGSTVVASAALDPAKVRGFELDGLGERLRRAILRLELGDPLVRATAPLGLLHDLAERGRVARERLLLVAGEGAALILAFAAFFASARRREAEQVDAQLATLGAARGQLWTARLAEVLVPGVAGALLALGGVWLAARVVAARRGLPSAFVSTALPPETILALAGTGLAGALLLAVSLAPRRRPHFGLGRLEVAALAALALVVWQTSTSGALDPERLAARGAGPVLLLLPALAFFATAVLLLRLLPPALRLGERLARSAPFGVRLAFLTAARSPAQAAAATTFLAIALGSALFSLDYRETLERQAGDQARFTAGAAWRVAGDVTPLTRFARMSAERPTPALRLDGALEPAQGPTLPLQVLAVPAGRIGDLLGWRDGFSALSRPEIARRLRPRPVRLEGPRIAADARELRVWARGRTDYPRLVVFHFLLPGQGFAHVRLGTAGRRWRLLRLPLGRSLRGAELVGVEFVPTQVPLTFKYDPKGFVELGPLEQRRQEGWSRLPSIAGWKESEAPDGTSGILNAWTFRGAPVSHGIRFDLNGTFQALIHPKLGLPARLAGFETAAVPALAGGPIAAQAVDGLVTLEVAGKRIPVRIAASARLFPTIVRQPQDFLVLDYDTLFAVLNAAQPGLAVPTEAWFFRPQPPAIAGLRGTRTVGVDRLSTALRADPLAAGTRTVLGVAAVVAAALALIGLVHAARSALAAERLLLAEYEALGVAPRTLRRSAQVRLLALSALGIGAGLLGAFASLRLIGAFVAVTGTARRPLPPIVPVVAWPAAAGVVAAVCVAGLTAAALLAGRALREAPAGRLRA